jgi:beta-N-acetylhexosaminidase
MANSLSTSTIADAWTVPDSALQAAPFGLDAEAIAWVRRTLGRLSLDQRLRQLLCEASTTDDPADADRLAKARLGGVARFVGADLKAAWQATRRLVEASEVPLLVAGDLEGGGIGMPCATPVPNQLGLAATDSPALAGEIAGLIAREARSLGFNWSFGPVLDINARFRSPIVSTRSFGDDPDRVLAMGCSVVRGLQREGVAATLKHWPGEGFDERDQHLLTTLNPLDMPAWERTFGRLYRALLDDGALCVMSAHIALPAWAERCGAVGKERYRPASVSRALNESLLRGQLGFNGLIVSDATMMAGLSSWGPRREVLPEVVASGCDMVLFSFAIDSDLAHLQRAVDDGRLSAERVEAAVTRVLALKAALGLHRQSVDERIPPFETTRRIVRSPQHMTLAETAACQSVTLVKDVLGLLPLSPVRHRRVVVIGDDDRGGFVNQPQPAPLELPRLLQAQGFEVRAYDPEHPPTVADTDLVLYLLAQESLYAQQTIQLDWRRLMGSREAAMDRYWHDLPTLLVSFGHPFYLFDAPRMPCVVNAYSPLPSVQQAVLQCLLGERRFSGVSPVDATCGIPDAVY